MAFALVWGELRVFGPLFFVDFHFFTLYNWQCIIECERRLSVWDA